MEIHFQNPRCLNKRIIPPAPFIKGGGERSSEGDFLSSRPGSQSVRILHSEQKSKALPQKFHSEISTDKSVALQSQNPSLYKQIHSELVSKLLFLECMNVSSSEKLLHDEVLEKICGHLMDKFKNNSVPVGTFFLGEDRSSNVSIDEPKAQYYITNTTNSFTQKNNSPELKDFFEIIKPFKEQFAELSLVHVSRWNELANILNEQSFLITISQASQSSNQSGNSNRNRNSSQNINTTNYSPGVIAGIGFTAMVIIYLIYSYISKIFSGKSQSSVSTNTEGGNLNFVMPSVSQSS